MNKYRLPQNAYNRYLDKSVSEDFIKERLVGSKQKEIIDVIADEDRMVCSAEMESEDKE